MKKRLIIIAGIFIVLIVISGICLTYIFREKANKENDKKQNIAVEMNEMKQLITSGKTDEAISKADDMALKSSETKDSSVFYSEVWIPAMLSIAAIIIMLVILYFRILKPFEKLKNFATEISKGNMDAELRADRGNYFGDFTWSFENMRKEIVKSRNAEKTAIENNKTVIASLSHDIKTPISSIRAYAEAFEANMDSTPEKKQKYLSVIMNKCDEVTKLTDDLFLHSISEMNRLEVKSEKMDLIKFFDEDVRELFATDDNVSIILPEEDQIRKLNPDSEKAVLMVSADSKRLLQIMENLKSNAEKYAKTDLEISLEIKAHKNDLSEVAIHFRDFGPGISEDEILFITGKFYRGKNIGDEPGSGLGLYIVNELVQKMDGKLALFNKNPGLDVEISFNV